VAGLDIEMRRELGLHVRELRQGKQLTLAQLAASVGISTSALSQIERGVIEPSLGTLWQLNDVLGSSLFDFFNRPHQARVQLCRSDERNAVQLDGYSYQTLVQASRRRLDLFILTLEPGEEPVRPPVAHYGEECGLVTAGRLEVHVGDELHVLEEGDSIWFDSTLPHTFRAAGGTPCTSIWTNTLPERAAAVGG
jgi:transcriptional regulator with XRE-family HTH domain